MIPNRVDPLSHTWLAVIESNKITEGQVFYARILGEDLAIWRLGDKVMVWQNLCPHRGSALVDPKGRFAASIVQRTMVCPYHNLDIDENGVGLGFPGQKGKISPKKFRIKTYHAKNMYGFVWVSFDDPTQDVPFFPEWADTKYRKVMCGPYFLKASGTRFIENALDLRHFIRVHAGILGDINHPEISDYVVTVGNDGVRAKGIKVWQPDPDGTGTGSEVTYDYWIPHPLVLHFTKRNVGGNFAMYFVVTPVEETESVVRAWIAMDYAHDMSEKAIRDFQDLIMSQDVPIVEAQRPQLLPRDLQAEAHMDFDKASIAYRKWIKKLGLTFGTA